MAGSPNLLAAFGMPPERAVEYFQSRGLAIRPDWKSVAEAVKAGSFSVAGVMKGQVLADIQAALEKSLSEGGTFKQFLEGLKPKLEAAGWYGKFPVDLETGEILPGRGMTPRRLQTVFRTNLQASYMAGRYKAGVEASRSHPYWMYVAVLDARTRPMHRALSGRVFMWNDPVWAVIYPPDAYNCRCRVRPLSTDEFQGGGHYLSRGDGCIETVDRDLGPKGGPVSVTGYRDPATKQLFLPDPGFDHNPAAAWGLDVDLAQRVAAVKNPDIRTQCWGALNASPYRASVWHDFVRVITDSRGDPVRKAGYDGFVLGFVDDAIAAFANAHQEPEEATRVVVMNARSLLHSDSERHLADGIALTPEQYAMLPGIVAKPDDVFWDRAHRNLAYVRYLVDGSAVILPVIPGFQLKKAGWVDAAINVYRVAAVPGGADRLKNAERFVRMEEGA